MADTMDEHVGKNLRALRDARLMTQEELAEKLGVDVTTVQRVEGGRTAPSKETLKRICEFFVVNLEKLREAPTSDLAAPPPPPSPSATMFEKPRHDPDREQLVRLDPVRRATSVGSALTGTRRSYFRIPGWLSPDQEVITQRLGLFLGNLMSGWFCVPKDERKEALLELQGEMDDLATVGLILAMGACEQSVLAPEGLPGVSPMTGHTLVASVLPSGTALRYVVLPLVSTWNGQAVTP